MRRWTGRTLAGVLAVLVLTGLLRWLDVAIGAVVALQMLGPVVVIGLVLLVVAAALLRHWRVLVSSGVALAVGLALALPTFFSSAEPGRTPVLTVLSANLGTGRADAAQVMDAVRAHSVDVLVLLEVTPEAVEELRQKGLDEHFTDSTGQARAGSTDGTQVYARLELETLAAGTTGEGAAQPEVGFRVEDTDVSLKAVHVPRAASGQVDAWRSALRGLGDWQAGREGPVVLAGTFNADSGHPGFRALTDRLEDAHRVAGLGWVRTWPVVGERPPPYVQLDHVLARGLTVVDAGQVAVHGTDHALVWASYALTGGE